MKDDPTDIRGLQRRDRESDEERRRKRLLELADLQAVLQTAAGRRFVWAQMERAGVFRTSFDNSGSVTAFNEGRRTIGLMLLADLQATKDLRELWHQAQEEAIGGD
jgi:hypothetical protein